ncbi:Hypothetical predicted protein [Lecanosticta acicola]|uniref:FAR-17a/AIG1-like protein n=1 Tax=Lecanosticta acicola TaxID=111012 RepID=A0AAI9EB41_9PEZI|nr:Hypothetical predicted protein [Lecanosticta acicola]
MQNPLSLSFFGMSSRPPSTDAARQYVTSYILHPYALALLRSIMSLYCFSTIIIGYSWLAHDSAPNTLKDIHIPTYTLLLDVGFIGESFSFFTFLTWWSLAFYFGISAFHTFDYARSLRRGGKPDELLQRSFSYHWSFELAYSLWHTTVTTYPFLVSIVFWAMMYGSPWPTSKFAQWINISVHGLNSLFTIFEVVFSAARPPAFLGHLLVVMLVLSMYLGLAYLSKATADFYPYAWMDPQFGWQGIVAHVFGYAGGMIGIYSVVWGVKWITSRIAEGPRTNSDSALTEDDEKTIWSKPDSSCSTHNDSKEWKEPVVIVVEEL